MMVFTESLKGVKFSSKSFLGKAGHISKLAGSAFSEGWEEIMQIRLLLKH